MNFSVLMSVYFKENPEYFDLALKSNLLDQTLKPSEFILVCDGPLNIELEKVIEKYSELFPEIFKVYRLSKNGGLGEALNYGLKKCMYEIIARSDSDDICVAERFEKQIEFLKITGMLLFWELRLMNLILTLINEYFSSFCQQTVLNFMNLQNSDLRLIICR